MAKKAPQNARRRGRPNIEAPRRIVVSFRLTNSEADALRAAAEGVGVVGVTARDVARDVVVKWLKSQGHLK